MRDDLLEGIVRLRENEQYGEAQAELNGLDATSLNAEQRLRIVAEESHLAYYRGAFDEGVRLAVSRAPSAISLAGCRLKIALSANLMALNRGHGALVAANQALLGLRMLKVEPGHTADALMQLAHVLANIGRPQDAARAARQALGIVRTNDAPRCARAHYTLGFALSFGGNEGSLSELLEAERLTRQRAGALWHWVLFCIAVDLRDRGHTEAAASFLARSNVTVRHERAWFAVCEGDRGQARAWLRLPIGKDERPFARCLVAASRFLERRPCTAAARASEEFRASGLDYWKWGADWLRLATEQRRDQRERGVEQLVEELEIRQARRWGFFLPEATKLALRSTSAATRPFARDLLERIGRRRSARAADDGTMLFALQLLNPEALITLRELGVAPAEMRSVLALLDAWLEGRSGGRRALSATLGLQDSTVRSHFNRVRSKLAIGSRRGVVPLVLWLAERDLLAPQSLTRALHRLGEPRRGGDSSSST